LDRFVWERIEREMPYLPPLPLAVVALEEALVVWDAVLAVDEPDDERKVSAMQMADGR
jgi:hypothetical protein